MIALQEASLLAPMKLYLPTVSVLPVALSRRKEYSAVALRVVSQRMVFDGGKHCGSLP
jgi:hypothetical protein